MSESTGIALIRSWPRLIWEGHDVTFWLFVIALGLLFVGAGVYGLTVNMARSGEPFLCANDNHDFVLIEPPSFSDPLWIYPRGWFRRCHRCGHIQERHHVGLWLDCHSTLESAKRGGA